VINAIKKYALHAMKLCARRVVIVVVVIPIINSIDVKDLWEHGEIMKKPVINYTVHRVISKIIVRYVKNRSVKTVL
jgi:hypothetical protein